MVSAYSKMKEISDNGVVWDALTTEWANWNVTKHTVPFFGFREYISKTFGFEYDRPNNGVDGFKYKITDEEKFMWYLLRLK
jgi:hypothetical protein